MDRENSDITFAFCHAHARRYFAEALKAIPKEQRDKAKGTVAHEALNDTFSLSVCLTASDNAAVRYVVQHVAIHPRIL